MASSTFKAVYPADSTALSMTGFGGLGSSATFVAGWEFAAISNRTNLDLDHHLSGNIMSSGTVNPTISTYIQIYVVPLLALVSGSPTWPDVMDGTASAETWTSVGIRDGAAVLAKTILVDATTQSRSYYFDGISVAALFGGVLPADYVVFVTHNMGTGLHATDGNHAIFYTRIQGQAV